MHLRSETSRSGVRWTIDEDRWIEPRIELGEEQLAPLGLICLIDLVGASSETGETAQEAPIGRIGPADVSRSAPTIGTQRVESTVISHPVLDGTDAVMLSGETALGADPANVVRTLRRILIRADADAASVTRPIPTNAERHQVDRGAGRNPLDADVITNALTHAGARAAADLENASIICWTRSGRTARALARHRPSSRLFAVSASVATLRQCSLSWGLLPLQVDDTELTDELVRRAVARCLETGEVAVGDLVVIITGAPEHPSGAAADMLRIVPIR